MAQLPFLVVHGAVVWKVLLLVLVAATFALGYAIRGFRARRATRAGHAALAPTISAPTAGPIVVRGRIVEGTAMSVSQETASEDLSTALVLDCGGERVELAGTIRVEQGTAVRASMRRPKELSPALPRGEPTVVRSVKVDDEVIAIGLLAPAPAPGEAASYREAKPNWTLTSADEPIRVLATRPRATPLPLSISQRVGALIVVVPVWFGILHFVGTTAIEHADRERALGGSLPELGAVELAAAMPGSRDKALGALRHVLRGMQGPRSERALELSLGLADLEGECPVQILSESARLEPALEAARRCGNHDEVVALLAFLGRFDEAERELAANDSGELATTLHIMTGHWKQAALGADARADRIAAESPGQYRTQRYLSHAASAQHCLAALLRTYAGVPDAFAKIPARGTDRSCMILEAASKPVSEQAAAFAALPEARLEDDTHDAGYDLSARQLGYAAGGEPSRYDSHGLSALIFMYSNARVWLAPFEIAAHPDDPRAHETMAAYDALIGDLPAARAELPHVSDYVRDELALALALRDGAPIAATVKRGDHPGLDEALALRQGMITDDVQRYMDPERGGTFRRDLDRALHGDGDGLVAALQEEFLQWQAFAIPVLGVLPRITQHRDHALAALRMFRDTLTTYSTDHLPFRLLDYLILYRDIARVAGDTEDAARWKTIVDRFVKMLGDRQKLTALLFWSD